MKEYSDISIIEGCRKQQPLYQKALFEKYSKLLFSTCLRYVSDQSLAKDVLQDSFIRIFKYFNKFDPEKGQLKSWMQRVCINEALTHLRAKKTFANLETLPQEPVTNPAVLSQMQMDDLMAQIQKLPLPYRTVFNLYHVEGYTHKEIAALLKIEVSSSRSILTRAKMKIKKILLEKKINESWI